MVLTVVSIMIGGVSIANADTVNTALESPAITLGVQTGNNCDTDTKY